VAALYDREMILGKMEGPDVEFCADDDERNYSSRSLNFRVTDHLAACARVSR
jgi:hypothetical protein